MSGSTAAPVTGRRRAGRAWPVGPGLALLAICAAGCGGAAPHRPAATTGATGGRTSPARTPPSGGVPPAVPVGVEPDGEIVADGSLWVADVGDGTVERIDVSSARVVAVIRVGGAPISFAAGPGAVWVADDSVNGRLLRIDTRSNRVSAVVKVGSQPTGVALVGGRLWAFDQGDGHAFVIDPGSARIVRRIALGNQAGLVTVAAGGIWVPDFAGPTPAIWRVDPVTGRVAERIPTGAQPLAVAFGDGSGWVTNLGAGSVTRFDPHSGRVQATILMPGETQIQGILVLPGIVWVADLNDNELVGVSPGTNRVVTTVPVGSGPRDVVAAAGALWVTDFGANAVSRVPAR